MRALLRTRVRRVLFAMFVLLLACALWLGWSAYQVYEGINRITSVAIPRQTVEPKIVIPPINGNQRINILVLGSDNDRKKEESRPLTQSIIVVTIDPKHARVGLLSIPRDLWVPIHGFPSAKIDVAAKDGGFGLTRATVESLFHIPIDYYAWVGLAGFQRVIDTFGGLTLDISHPIIDDYYPNDITSSDPYGYTRLFMPPGWRYVSGRQALDYVRSRHGDLVGDFGRSARQQQILVGLRQKLTTMNIFWNLPTLVGELQNSVQTDLGITQLYQLYELSHRIQSANIQRVILQAPTYCTEQIVDGQDALVPNWAAIRPVVARLFAPIDSSASAPAKVQPPPPVRAAPTAITRSSVLPSTPVPAHSGGGDVAGDWQGSLPARLLYIGNGQVAEMSRSGQFHPLTGGGNAMPSMSPNGRYIAYVHYSTAYASDLFIHDQLRGTDIQVTHDESSNVHNNLWVAWPQWSPDGKQLLFSTDRAKLSAAPSEIRPVDMTVWSLSWPGGNPTEVTPVRAYTGGDTDPQWRPHTHQIMYVAWDYDHGTLNPYSRLAVYSPTTGRSTFLTVAGQRVLQAQLDSTGDRVVFIRSSGVGAAAEVDVAPIAGGSHWPHLGPITTLASGEVAQPAFTPDGRWVSFLRQSGSGFSLYMVPSSGGPIRRISQVGSNLDATSRPVWIR